MMKSGSHLLLAIIIISFSAGCTNKIKDDQLSEVAKGWCRTIRASQVLPVYPLTEDIQVGDLFIVQRPVEDEVQLYNEKGFLPLGNHVERLFPIDGYKDFYQGGYHVGEDGKFPPFVWSTPHTPTSNPPNNPPNNPPPSTQGYTQPMETDWAYAPRASFPSYQFNIDNREGLDIGLPISGVPVGLSLLGSQKASANVTLADAFTYGVPTASMADLVGDWAGKTENRAKLALYQPNYILGPDNAHYQRRYNFLRVVTRVYLVNRVNVSIVDSNSASASVDVRLPNVKLTGDAAKAAGDAYQDRLKRINDGLAGTNTATGDAGAVSSGAIGGSLKATSVTDRSVSLQETFPRPLVVGYLATDFPIYERGDIGRAPVSTLVRLSEGSRASAYNRVQEWARDDPVANAKLDYWLGSGGNGWMKSQGFPDRLWNSTVDKEASINLGHYLRTPNLGRWILAIFQTRDANLRRKIFYEVVLRPDWSTTTIYGDVGGTTTTKTAAPTTLPVER